MIVYKELNPKGFPTTPEIEKNLKELLKRINVVRTEWNRPMRVTSGLRSKEDHLRIYRNIAISKNKPFDESKVPMASKHLYGKACDILDPNGELMAWLKANPEVLKDAGLWCEEGCLGWVHFQIEPPKSGKRWFLP